MAQRLVLHVGAMKSATSYLQALLFANQTHLAQHQTLVPGEEWSDLARAVRQGLAPKRGGERPKWDALVDAVRRHEGTAVISMEYLGPAAAETVSHVLEAFGVSDVRVVLTARDLNRSLVSLWQETVQNGRTWSWADYVADAAAKRPTDESREADRNTAGGTFWRQQDLVRITEIWAGAVGIDNFRLVTVPPPDADHGVLAQRFTEAVELPLDLSVELSRANESLGLASALVLRELNLLLNARGLEFPAGQMLRKRILAKQVLSARKGEEQPLGLAVADWVVDHTATAVATLQAAGVRLIGEWSDLDPIAVSGVQPDDVPQQDISDAALAGLAGLIAEQMQNRPAD